MDARPNPSAGSLPLEPIGVRTERRLEQVGHVRGLDVGVPLVSGLNRDRGATLATEAETARRRDADRRPEGVTLAEPRLDGLEDLVGADVGTADVVGVAIVRTDEDVGCETVALLIGSTVHLRGPVSSLVTARVRGRVDR